MSGTNTSERGPNWSREDNKGSEHFARICGPVVTQEAGKENAGVLSWKRNSEHMTFPVTVDQYCQLTHRDSTLLNPDI